MSTFDKIKKIGARKKEKYDESYSLTSDPITVKLQLSSWRVTCCDMKNGRGCHC